MTNSFTTLMKNVNNMLAWMTPYYFKFLYYFAVPTVIAAGKSTNHHSHLRSANEAQKSNRRGSYRVCFRIQYTDATPIWRIWSSARHVLTAEEYMTLRRLIHKKQ